MMGEAQLDRYLPASIRGYIEQQYYARINAQARLEHLLQDPEFLRNPARHAALFADHGVVHVRDVATQILRVLDTINGVLISARDKSRLEFMKAYGVTVAYLHDIGMTDFSPFGRAMHPEFVAQMVFDAAFDGIVEILWDANRAGIAGRLAELADMGAVDQDPRIVLRELLAMASCHSKSKVPIEVLNDATLLGQTMRAMVGTDLQILYRTNRPGQAHGLLPAGARREAETDEPPSICSGGQTARLQHALRRFYGDVQRDSFAWLLSEHDATRDLQGDVVDTLRALRCADALRQRGTVLKTSGSYEIFVDQMTGNAVFALRNADEQLFLLATQDPIAGGEANLASSELGGDGNLHVAFHRGAFADQKTTQYAAYCAGIVVNDVQLDVVESFKRPTLPGEGHGNGLKSGQDLQILLESLDDNLEFAVLVGEQLEQINPRLHGRISVVPSLRQVPGLETARYLQAPVFDWDIASRNNLLDKVARSGHSIQHIDPVEAFRHTKLVALKAGETLCEAGTAAHFVYIPLGEGVKIMPLGGYQPFSVRAWMPLGITGVIRGASRNATVVTDLDITLLLIPKEVYLRQWHHPYSATELAQRLAPHQ